MGEWREQFPESMKYEFLDHTADIMIRSYGSSWKELLINSIEAMKKAVVDSHNMKLDNFSQVFQFEYDKHTNTEIFHEFMNDVKDLMYFGHVVITDIIFEDLVTARLIGHTADIVFSGEIKSVTWHELNVKGPEETKDPNKWEATFILDV